MQTDRPFTFCPYRWDPHTGQLWRGKQEVRLTGKAVAALRQLIDRTGQVVTKEEFFQTVWPDTVVSDAALSSCIQELRQALRDNAKQPRYIETVHRRGFRFLPAVTTQPGGNRQKAGARSQEDGENQKANGKNQKAKVENIE